MKGMVENLFKNDTKLITHIKNAYGRRRPSLIFLAISYALWASVTLRWIMEFIEQEHPLTALVSAILLLYGLLLGLEPLLTYQSPLRGHLYLLIQLALIVAALLLYFELDFFAILLMPLAGQAAFIFPRRTAAAWGIIFLATNFLGQIHQFGWPGGLPFMFLYAAGILFVVAFSLITLNAEASRRRSEALLAELQSYAGQAEALAIAQERNRLARELHDSVAQTLYGLTLQAEAANRKLAAGQLEAVSDYLNFFRDSAQQTLLETRLLIFELRPPILDEVGLTAALRTRLEAVESRSSLDYQLDLAEVERLPSQVETGLYRITQEALNNILKHARASQVNLSLQQNGERIRLEIRDDGVGFDLEARTPHGYGLQGMRERAEQLGGSFNLQSKPQGGTTIIVEAPI
jgi:signal transduction histidine kinase